MKFKVKLLSRCIAFCYICLSVLTLAACGGSSDSTDAEPVLQAGIYDSTVVEGADDLEFVVSLSDASTEPVSVDYATADGTAVAGSDYLAASGTLSFAPGETRKFIPVSVTDNTSLSAASSKSMRLILSKPQNVTIHNDMASGTILDSDAIPIDSVHSDNWTAVGTFTNAATCANGCHVRGGASMDYNGKDVSPGTQWRHSVMANAFNDPYWQAAVEDETSSFPQLAGFIEDICTTCHAPMGRTHAHHTATDLDADNHFRFDTAKTQDHSREGVSCTVCHQIDAGNLGTAESFSGGFSIVGDPLDADYKNIYGQYDVSAGAMRMANITGGHTPVEGPYVSESALCATCHTLFTPSLDPDTGAPSGNSFLEQGVYFEWQNSDYATGKSQDTQCQGCHMPEPAPGYATAITLDPANVPNDRSPYPQHTLVGGNAHLLEILRDYRTELGIASTTTITGFDEQVALTRSFLGSAASINVPALVTDDDVLEFDVEVTNNAGHKIPTAYPSRRTWLHVVVKSAGNIIFESGKPDSRGYISTDAARLKADCMAGHKLDGFDSSQCYEPHRDVISEESQVAIYETVLGDVNGDITHTLLQAASYLKDNRIPPAGFTNSKAATIEEQTIPSGVAGDENFNCVTVTEGCGMDTVRYQVDIEGQSGPYTVEVELLYQATQPGFVDGMHNVGDRVNRFKVMYDAVPPSVEVLATATK